MNYFYIKCLPVTFEMNLKLDNRSQVDNRSQQYNLYVVIKLTWYDILK